MGADPWSPKLQVLRDAIGVWKLVNKKKSGGKVSSRLLRRQAKKANIRSPYSLSPDQARVAESDAIINYRRGKLKAAKWRRDHNRTLEAALAKANGSTEQAERRNLNRIETQRRQSRRIRRMTGKFQEGGLSKIEILQPDGSISTYTSKHGIEKGCIDQTIEKYSQTEDTPPMTEPLLSHLGFLAETPEALQILDGSYDPPSTLDPYAKKLLAELRMPKIVQENRIPSDIPTAEHKQFWQRMDARKGCEPSDLSHAHYKVASQDQLLADFDASLRQLPYQHGFAPDGWVNMTAVQLRKKLDVILVHKLRTIVLMSSQFNTNNKKLGRDVMRHAEALKLLPPDQGGSRQDHRANELGLNKVLAFDLLRQLRQAGALCSNDAKSCYDRIVHAIAILCMVRLGSLFAPVISMFKVLQAAVYKIRTTYGDSELTVTSPSAKPFQGSGQGNGCGPALWVAVSAPIIQMLYTAGYGMTVLSAVSGTLLSIACFAFVDDTDVIHSRPSTTGEEIGSEMQNVMNTWEGGIRATGGALEPSKSHWYLIDFKWIPQRLRWDYRLLDELPGTLRVRNPQGHQEILERVEVNQGRVSLGINIAPDGSQEGERLFLLEKIQLWISKFKANHMNCVDTWYAFNNTIMKTLEYPMIAISLTRKQWNTLMSPLLAAILPKARISRSFPWKVIFAPLSRQGLGLIHPHDRQFLAQIQTVFRHSDRTSPTGQLMRTSLEQLQLELGIPEPVFESSFTTFGVLSTPCWLSHIWEYCDSKGITLVAHLPDASLQAADPWKPLHSQTLSKQTTDDKFLMKLFSSHDYQGETLFALNVCRMYLNATTISDITTADGLFITTNAWTGHRDENKRSPYTWPRSHRPPNAVWQVWQEALTKSVLVAPHQDLRVKHAIGNWNDDPKLWNWFSNQDKTILYHREGTLWRIFRPRTGRSTRYSSHRLFHRDQSTTQILPHSLQRATVYRDPKDHSQATLTGIGQQHTPIDAELDPTSPNTVADAIKMYRSSDGRWFLDEIHGHPDSKRLIRAIKSNRLRIVSDGSYKKGFSTAACVLTDTARSFSLEIRSVIPGDPTIQDSYRAELGGLYSAIIMVRLLQLIHNLTPATIEIACDGLQAIINAFDTRPLDPSQSQYDLLLCIRRELQHSPMTWNPRHVTGHSKKKRGHTLDWWEECNEEMDTAAKEHRRKTENNTRPDTSKPLSRFDGWHLIHQGQRLTRVRIDHLYDRIYAPETESYWIRRKHIRPSAKRKIYWDGIKDASSKLRPGKRRWMVKHVTEICGIGKFKKRWDPNSHNRCPRCSQREDVPHIIKCTHGAANETWDQSMDSLSTWLSSQQTFPSMSQLFITRLTAWRENKETHFPLPGVSFLSQAYHEQSDIGWFNFLQGRISNYWVYIQSAYYEHLDSRRTGHTWAKNLIQHLWTISWNMWQNRNYILHNVHTAADTGLASKLNHRIRKEFDLDVDGLAPIHHYMIRRMRLTRILLWDNPEKIAWLATIKTARIAWKRKIKQSRLQRQMLRESMQPP
jgi:hypothetical protein